MFPWCFSVFFCDGYVFETLLRFEVFRVIQEPKFLKLLLRDKKFWILTFLRMWNNIPKTWIKNKKTKHEIKMGAQETKRQPLMVATQEFETGNKKETTKTLIQSHNNLSALLSERILSCLCCNANDAMSSVCKITNARNPERFFFLSNFRCPAVGFKNRTKRVQARKHRSWKQIYGQTWN